MYFGDTNLFIRFLTKDDLVKAQAVYNLLQKVKKKEVELHVSEIVLAEIVHILSSKILYNLPRSEVKNKLQTLLLLENLKIPNKKNYFKALDFYSEYNIDFADCLIASRVLESDLKLISFDKDFRKIEEMNGKIESL
jgi:predicted nucleic-acid-binding protein